MGCRFRIGQTSPWIPGSGKNDLSVGGNQSPFGVRSTAGVLVELGSARLAQGKTSVKCRVHLARARCVPFVIEPPVWRHMPRFAKTDKIVWRKQKLPFPERGAIAQLGERIVRNDEVVGSSPTSSTMFSATCGPCCRFPSPFVLLFVS